MELINPTASPKYSFKRFGLHRSSLTVHSSNLFEIPASKLKKNIMKKLSFYILNEELTAHAKVVSKVADPEEKIIGDDFSDPPSILYIESEPEEDKKESPEDLLKAVCHESYETFTLACRPTEVTKSNTTNQISQVTRVLSSQLSPSKDEGVKLQMQRSYSAKLQIVKIDELTRTSDSFKDYLCTLFGSLCLIKEIDPVIKSCPPSAILSLPKPQGLLCTS
jgi:hypothetical protein